MFFQSTYITKPSTHLGSKKLSTMKAFKYMYVCILLLLQYHTSKHNVKINTCKMLKETKIVKLIVCFMK